ncbi:MULTISPECIES: type II toxin-antitoxin system RelE/ParE family toxin [unclassified Mesorhizobium]|uniref:type II toxin-antitoxin system RelE/ParE family toxin n=1 Tax=unclassified Mesorhizobium TaxID=325217 RepID=UPI00112EB08F|nr:MULTISPECIES: type II toxin-antitoxin system RelE/ParE family toxin [unclassified Mesorhizobium]MBZ9739428.1 type II toxin-antitoxin system RelE/ParE family toxin [Mesorhizobium sp. CO1-1-4]MBZ9801532.1 type II toxin-antitoxin system RelE/ParE family toxin [Mesorhizobium sp. ES1-6]MBZ9992441.1 type II toxin-antitoxin system RelE/ParE family toxin [Mesorhizobium sp. BH1-1-4]TPL91152.1 type II toxin-antitoxin system RelE/ParE family toxin [Mesorhizobium sp. B2-3-12]
MALSFAPAAVQDIEEIGDYIHAENPAAAYRLISALRERCGRIANAPRGGAPRSALWPGLRSVAFQKYVIFYIAQGNDVRVERILHGARDIAGIFDEGKMPKDM